MYSEKKENAFMPSSNEILEQSDIEGLRLYAPESQLHQEISAKLLGNLCGSRGTSCADQLAKAVMQA